MPIKVFFTLNLKIISNYSTLNFKNLLHSSEMTLSKYKMTILFVFNFSSMSPIL